MKLRDRVSQSDLRRTLGVSMRTMGRWQEKGYLPKPVQVGTGKGARYFYYKDELAKCEAICGR